jgi:hypothetical protein
LAASGITRLNDRPSDKVLCTSTMFSKPGAVFPDQLFVHVHDEVVVLGADRRDPT